MYHILFIHSSVDGLLDCLHVPIVNSAAMNILQCILQCMYLFKLWFSMGVYPRVGLLPYSFKIK